MKRVSMVSLAITGAIFLISGLALAGEAGEKDKQGDELADKAKVSIAQAINAVTDEFPGKVIEAELEDEGGKLIYEVEVVGHSGNTWEFEVDAQSGQVIGTESESADMKAAEDDGEA